MSPEMYAGALAGCLRQEADVAQATAMEAYLKGQFRCLGIRTPRRRELQKAFYAAHGRPGKAQWEAVVRTLVLMEERELQHAGLELMYDRRREWTAGTARLIGWSIQQYSWWDTVDFIAVKCLGHYCRAFPEEGMVLVKKFIDSDDLWLKRSAIIYQNGYKKNTNEAVLYQNIRQCTGIRYFFIEKAIGWALREYAKVNAESVKAFVKTTSMSGLSRREALKYWDSEG